MEMCKHMLESEQLDVNRLGLESLCTLTDPSKILAKEADEACRMVLADSAFQALLEKHFVDMECPSKQHADADEGATMDYEQGSFFGSMHLLALKVMSNALESSSAVGVSVDLSSVFWQTAVKALYYNLQVASRRPLEASLSTRCLRLMQTLEPAMLELAPSHNSLQIVLMSAHKFGRDHNRSLELETNHLMGRLEYVQ